MAAANATAVKPLAVAEAQASHGPETKSLPQSQMVDIQKLVGLDASASTIANLLASGAELVDINDKLKSIGLETLQYHLRPDLLVWSVLDAESKAAANSNRKAFAYLDLTSKELLPIWVPADLVGGKSLVGGGEGGGGRMVILHRP